MLTCLLERSHLAQILSQPTCDLHVITVYGRCLHLKTKKHNTKQITLTYQFDISNIDLIPQADL